MMELEQMTPQEQRAAKSEALSNFEQACNVVAILFAHEPETSPTADVRRIVLQARGDVREAIGEPRT